MKFLSGQTTVEYRIEFAAYYLKRKSFISFEKRRIVARAYATRTALEICMIFAALSTGGPKIMYSILDEWPTTPQYTIPEESMPTIINEPSLFIYFF